MDHVAGLLTMMQEWRKNRRAYHLLIEERCCLKRCFTSKNPKRIQIYKYNGLLQIIFVKENKPKLDRFDDFYVMFNNDILNFYVLFHYNSLKRVICTFLLYLLRASIRLYHIIFIYSINLRLHLHCLFRPDNNNL